MFKTILTTVAMAGLLVETALADTYPVSGKWGESATTEKGAIDCTGLRVVDFKGDQRTDSGGGVPAYRNRSVTPDGPGRYRIVDDFSTGQIRARTRYTLKQVEADRIELELQRGGTIKLQRCK